MIVNSKTLLVSSFISIAAFAQGSLTPPSGPAPSMKTLGQIEPRTVIEKLPFKISAPGSYYVGTNLFVPGSQAGITVDADNVSLDLSGFVISGTDTSLAGISVASGRTGVSIRNGAITSVSVGIAAASATHLQVDSIRVSKCGDGGISVGADSLVSNCTASENSSSGIVVGLNSTVVNCQAAANAGNGIEAGQKCTVRESSAARNDFSGISVGDYSKVIGVTSTDNSGFGINGGTGVHITDCTANANRGHGINSGNISSITRANASWNGQNGINLIDGSTLIDCSVTGNAFIGIFTGNNAHVAGCKGDSNGAGGIAVARGSTVRDCSVQKNGNDGISVTDQCVVSRNNATLNANLKTASGIHVRGTDNVIQENTVTSNDRGLTIEVEGNFIVKNTATNNSLNFFTVGDQMMGPVVTTFDGADTIHPMSNFIY